MIWKVRGGKEKLNTREGGKDGKGEEWKSEERGGSRKVEENI